MPSQKPIKSKGLPPLRVNPEMIDMGQTEPDTMPLSLPGYLMEQVRTEAFMRKVTKKFVIMEALAARGFFIDEEDMREDGRRDRGSRGRNTDEGVTPVGKRPGRRAPG